MPPSSALRCSPGRDHQMESTHRRGRSFESGLTLKAKDDNLALFNEMQNRESENFLLQTSDDFEDSISKLRYFSDLKLSINIPARGESSDLLNVDVEKNDYDWLLTPPDTPLFPSLDDDEPQAVNPAPRSRPQSQPISIPRSSMGQKVYRTNRSSASPHRLSPSPRSSYSPVQSRVGPSSAPHSSPPPVLRSTTPSRRSSTPTKPSTPTQRSSTPTLRRMSTGSSGQAFSSGTRGISPVKATRGNSASPKLRGWQSNFPGFSSDAPPNLRTSPSDRSTSRVRGLSPASVNGRDLSSKFHRQSISPSVSRSACSSHSQERDHLSSYSKASSGEDDMDSMHSVTIGIYGNSIAKKNGASANSRVMAFSKKPSRTPSASSAPKRYIDSALRQSDHRKTPHNMFRPLLSSVPATIFYVGKANSMHRPMFSRNSSLTTSSNASSEQGASVALDVEDSDHEQGDLAGDWEKTQDHDTQEGVFMFDKVDEINEDASQNIDACKLQSSNETFDEGMANEAMTNKMDSHELDNFMSNVGVAASVAAASQTSNAANEQSEVGCHEMMAICSKCGKRFRVMEVDGDMVVCEECAAKDRVVSLASAEPGTNVLVTLHKMVEPDISTGNDSLTVKDRLCGEVQLQTGVLEMPERSSSEVIVGQRGRNSKQEPDLLRESSSFQLAKDQELNLSHQQMDNQSEMSIPEPDYRNMSQQSQPISHPSLRVDNLEGTGISVLLLQRSSSSKWPVVQGRAFSATNILCSEPLYARDNISAMKRSIGRDSASASSSVDLGSSRHVEVHVQRQLSSRKGEMDNMRSDFNSSTQSIGSHSEISINVSEALVPPKSGTETGFDNFIGSTENEAQQQIFFATEEHDNSSKDTKLGAMEHSSIGQAVVDGDATVYADGYMALSVSDTQSLSHPLSINMLEALSADNLNEEECTSSNNADEVLCQNKERSIQNMEVVIASPDCSISVEDHMPCNTGCQDDISDAATGNSSVVVSHDSQTECRLSQMSSNMEDIHEGRISTTSDKDLLVSASESNAAEHPYYNHEEPTVVVEGSSRQMLRSLTLEEATDTILFCSSIIHDLAYKAATIGMEKELGPPEVPHPSVTILGKFISDHKGLHKMSNKRSPNSGKIRRKKLETETKLPSRELGNDLKSTESTPANSEISNTVNSAKPPKLESKCNCTVM